MSLKNKHARHSRIFISKHLEDLQNTNLSEREFSNSQGIPKSTLQGWRYSREKIDAPPTQIEFFESEIGQCFLERLVYAVIFHLHECGSVSLNLVSACFKDIGISKFFASSPTYLKKLARSMQDEVANFGKEQVATMSKNMSPRKISVAQDETFFNGQPCLVGIALYSNYIFLEKIVADRRADTWNFNMEQALKGLNVTVLQSCSDQGSSLIKHVEEHLSASSSPDLFHIIQDISRSGSRALACKEKGYLDKLTNEHEKTMKLTQKYELSSERPFVQHTHESRLSIQANTELRTLTNLREAQLNCKNFKIARNGVSLNYHPYELKTGLPQSPEKVKALLLENMDQCQKAIADLGGKAQQKLNKAIRLIPKMCASLTFFFSTIAAFIEELGLDPRAKYLIEDELIPAAYLSIVAEKSRDKTSTKRFLDLANEKRIDCLRGCGAYACFSEQERTLMLETATEMAQVFQRSSSCVEGRNGQLKLRYHNLHRLTQRKLSSLTVIHNFHIRRSDRTTPAQRFFRKTHPPLFETVLARMPELARPRKHKRKVA